MTTEPQTPQTFSSGTRSGRWSERFGDSVVSGFIATFAMTIVMAVFYGLSHAIGDAEGTLIERWFWALTHNPVVRTTEDAVILALALNLLMGLFWAVIYGYWAEPRLGGPGWRKGMLFALGPWVLSVIAFLPLMGGGFLGARIEAGPLPVIGNLILHLVYGAVLGGVYGIDLAAWTDGSETELANAKAQLRGAAYGIVGGLVIGTVAGWLVGPSLEDIGSRSLITLVGALSVGALGLLFGSLLGPELTRTSRRALSPERR